MPASSDLILGEYRRRIDERYRVSIPPELLGSLAGEQPVACILAKERPGALSLWHAAQWHEPLDQGVALLQSKISAGRFAGRVEEIQLLGRLLSTRHRDVQLAGRGRLVIPEGFREFLGVEAGGEVLLIGAAVCIEIWRPAAWVGYLEERIPEFRRLFDELSS